MTSEIDPKLFIEIEKNINSPFFIYDLQHIRNQFSKLENSFSILNHKIHYAMKANSNVQVLKTILELGGGIDAASIGEVKIALDCGFKPEDIIYTPSCVSIEEIENVMTENVIVHFGAIEYLRVFGDQLSGKEIGIRINPGIEIEGNQKVITSHQNSKFGIPDIFLDKVIQLEEKYKFKIIGLHIHSGSNINNTDKLIESTKSQFSYIPLFKHLRYIDIGGGLKVKYHKNDKEFDLDTYASFIKKEIDKINTDLEIKIEPGKYLVANSGYLVTKANIVKQGHVKNLSA
ncbi:MAG: hypothetical protein R2771_02780 [Saprospiraceae bacterium]